MDIDGNMGIQEEIHRERTHKAELATRNRRIEAREILPAGVEKQQINEGAANPFCSIFHRLPYRAPFLSKIHELASWHTPRWCSASRSVKATRALLPTVGQSGPEPKKKRCRCLSTGCAT
jgi:hypothetical protein